MHLISASMKLTGRRQLRNGVLMPLVHLGVYLASRAEARQAVEWALEVSFPITPFHCVGVVQLADLGEYRAEGR
jgi:hypothetical protein